jgi:hypothetical protein
VAINSISCVVGALICAGAVSAYAQDTVYKCGSRRAVIYSQQPCGGTIISTEQAPVPGKADARELDRRKLQEARLLAMSMRQRPGESKEDFELRRRRARLLAPERAECARLDTRMPVELESMKNPDPAQAMRAQTALADSRKRFGQLHC